MREGPVLLRRLLLALVTTLIVARPLVVGEDPGLLANFSDPWGLVLTLLWLLAALGWAAWRYALRSTTPGLSRDRQGADDSPAQPLSDGRGSDGTLNPQHWFGGIVQTALLLTVALVFLSAEWAAHNKFPARLIAWEWFGLLIAFFVVRQLAVTPREQHGLFAVVLASAAALTAQGIYQEIVELPNNRRLAENPKVFRKVWMEENPGQEVNEGALEQLRLRAFQSNLYGPYAHPNSYAGFLLLWLPGLIGAVVVCRRMHALAWQVVLTAFFAGLGLTVLWLTHSRGAMLGLAVAAAAAGLFLYRRPLRVHAVAVLIGLLVLIGLVYGGGRSGLFTTVIGKTNNTIAQRREYWETTWRMIRERPWLGVGPGNFGENYPRLMPETAEEKIKDPHNFALEMWATCGVFAMLALLATLAAFLYQVLRWLACQPAAPARAEEALAGAAGWQANHLTSAATEVRWEFYLGGMFGLLLGFVMRINTATPGSIMTETYAAALRSVVWFGAFGLFERVYWTDRGRLLALTTGIAALLLNLCVSGGIGFPSVAGPLWIAVALALNAASLRPSPWLSRAGAAMILPLPIFLGVFLGCGLYILYPVLASDGLVREAVQAVIFFEEERAKPPSQQSAGVRDQPAAFIQKRVVERLEEAARLTPNDARIYVQLAWWTNVIWDVKRRRTQSSDLGIAERALLCGVKATQIDPQGSLGYRVQYRLRVEYAKVNEDSASKARKQHADPLFIGTREQVARSQYELAAQTLEKFLPNDPHDAGLHYDLALAWFKAGDKDKGRQHAEEALRLDELLTLPTRKLADRQHSQLREWIQKAPTS